MSKPVIDHDALISMFENATARQAAQLRKAVSDATLAALQGRELSLKNIRQVLSGVGGAVSAGAAKNTAANIDVEALLGKAAAGMDDALLKAVEANQVALQRFVAQGSDLREKHLKKALGDLEKFEDTLFDAVKKSAGGAGAQLAGPWEQVLEKMQAGGTLSGAKASAAAEQLAAQMQAAVRDSRSAGLRAAQALADSYAAMVSGVLIGMSDALQQQGKAKTAKS
ncbi:MAG TPA: DUF6781 family protein [Methylibium sp.]